MGKGRWSRVTERMQKCCRVGLSVTIPRSVCVRNRGVRRNQRGEVFRLAMHAVW